MKLLARGIAPVLRRVFPEIPRDHPAMASMMMNIAAKHAWSQQCRHSARSQGDGGSPETEPSPGVATNSMCTFLAVNTAGLQLIPASMISLLASAGSKEPTAIIGTTIAASTAAVFTGVIAAKLLERLPVFAVPPREWGGASS